MNEQTRRNRLLEFLTAPVKPAGEVTRSNRRRRSSARVQVAWSDGAEWRTIRGRLRDISRAGAGLLSATAPPLTGRARLRLVEGQETPWIEAEIVGVENEPRHRFRVRLRFLSPCPSFMLQPAILGQIAVDDQLQEQTCAWSEWNPEATD